VAAVKLVMRPGFEVALHVDEQSQERLLEALAWFREAATAVRPAAGNVGALRAGPAHRLSAARQKRARWPALDRAAPGAPP